MLVGLDFPLWNRLFGGHDAPVGHITSQKRVLVLRPFYFLPASSLRHPSCLAVVWKRPFFTSLAVDM